MEQSDTEDLPVWVSNIPPEIAEKPSLRDCCRIGVKRSTYARPIKLTVSSSNMACQVIRKLKSSIVAVKRGDQVCVVPWQNGWGETSSQEAHTETEIKTWSWAWQVLCNQEQLGGQCLQPLGWSLDLCFHSSYFTSVFTTHNSYFAFYASGPFNCGHGSFCVYPCLVTLWNIHYLAFCSHYFISYCVVM